MRDSKDGTWLVMVGLALMLVSYMMHLSRASTLQEGIQTRTEILESQVEGLTETVLLRLPCACNKEDF